uniref:Prolyl 4-hydroxylase alpha subunit domain-containing protein n=1 Tax=Bionectria ochroleuca TaxID=29856 RepID=A0A8H7N9Y2_BIOOC
MKRKAEATSQNGRSDTGLKKPKTSLSPEKAKERFRKGLFDQDVTDAYTAEYANSAPYKHAVIHQLVDDQLLRNVRTEIKENVSFTPKETDIYKIHQSGDLANLDGLDDESLSKLPSLKRLRDAIYSETFRNYVSHITNCGPLSGKKTDLAINIYTPGCFLLCHDDVIGSRRVSYILYLVDPDTTWKPEWGGALRLFPVQEIEGKDGEVAKTPLPDPSKVIPPPGTSSASSPSSRERASTTSRRCTVPSLPSSSRRMAAASGWPSAVGSISPSPVRKGTLRARRRGTPRTVA